MSLKHDLTRHAVEETRLERDLNNLTNLLQGFDKNQHPKYLLQAIANLEHRLHDVRQARD